MTWIIQGSAVIDRILNVSRSTAIEVYCDRTPPSESAVRELVKNTAPISYVIGKRHVAFCFDQIALDPNGTLCFADTREAIGDITNGEWLTAPLAGLILLQDAVRLKCLKDSYPELIISYPLLEFINASYAFVVNCAVWDPECSYILAKLCAR